MVQINGKKVYLYQQVEALSFQIYWRCVVAALKIILFYWGQVTSYLGKAGYQLWWPCLTKDLKADPPTPQKRWFALAWLNKPGVVTRRILRTTQNNSIFYLHKRYRLRERIHYGRRNNKNQECLCSCHNQDFHTVRDFLRIHSHLCYKTNKYFFYVRTNLTAIYCRNGTGQDFLDPTGKFQNHRRSTGFWSDRSTGIFTEGFCSLCNVSNEKFSKGGGHGWGVKICDFGRGSQKKICFFSAKMTQF